MAPVLGASLVDRLHAMAVWSAARARFTDGNLHEALRLVRSLSRDPMRPWHWRVFEIQLLCLLNKHAATLREVKDLAARAANEALSPDERYLFCFAQWCGQTCFARSSPGAPLPPFLRFDFDGWVLADVAPRWRRLFPLNVHPAWQVRWPGWWWSEEEGPRPTPPGAERLVQSAS